MKTSVISKLIALAAGLLLATNTGRAFIAGPYTTDAYTLHLWHLDETNVPCIDSVSSSPLNLSGLVNGAQLTNAAYAGFGTCMNTLGTYSYSAWMSNSAAASSFAGAGLFSTTTTTAAIGHELYGRQRGFYYRSAPLPALSGRDQLRRGGQWGHGARDHQLADYIW